MYAISSRRAQKFVMAVKLFSETYPGIPSAESVLNLFIEPMNT